MDGFVDRLHALRFLRACDPSYRALTFPLVGLPPTEHISLLLDIPCHRHYPGRFHGACSLVSLHRLRSSLCNSQVGSCNYFFGASSAFTHVMACTPAESPSDPLHRKLRQLRCLLRECVDPGSLSRSVIGDRPSHPIYRVERTSSRAGLAPAEVQRLFTAHCFANYRHAQTTSRLRSGGKPADWFLSKKERPHSGRGRQ
jgi:hypothetical protein